MTIRDDFDSDGYRDVPPGESSLWIERFPKRLGFEQLGRDLTGREGLGAYLLVAVAAGIDVGGSLAAKFLYGHTPPLMLNPFWILLPVGLLLAVWSARKMREWCESLMRKVNLERRAESFEATEFDELLPSRIRLAAFVFIIVLYATTILSTSVDAILANVGSVIGFMKWGVLLPFVYLPIVVDWGMILLGIHFVLPRHIRDAEFKLDFTDPLNFGGMYEFGALLKYSYYMYVGALFLFLLWRYGEALSGKLIQTPYPDPTIVHTVQFAAAWLLGVGFLAHSLYVFHIHMTEAKERKLEEINRRIRELGDDSSTLPETDPDPENIDRIRFEYEQMQVVKETRELPVGFSMASQLLFSAILPVLIERAFSLVL